MIDDNIIVEDTLINNNGRGRFYASSEQWKFGVWEIQVRDYVENISLGLPNARLLKQHSFDDRWWWRIVVDENHTFVLVDKIMYRMTISQYEIDWYLRRECRVGTEVRLEIIVVLRRRSRSKTEVRSGSRLQFQRLFYVRDQTDTRIASAVVRSSWSKQLMKHASAIGRSTRLTISWCTRYNDDADNYLTHRKSTNGAVKDAVLRREARERIRDATTSRKATSRSASDSCVCVCVCDLGTE